MSAGNVVALFMQKLFSFIVWNFSFLFRNCKEFDRSHGPLWVAKILVPWARLVLGNMSHRAKSMFHKRLSGRKLMKFNKTGARDTLNCCFLQDLGFFSKENVLWPLWVNNETDCYFDVEQTILSIQNHRLCLPVFHVSKKYEANVSLLWSLTNKNVAP